MRNIILLLIATFALSGCSSSVRPVYSDTADVTEEMRAQADKLGLPLTESGSLILAKALAQGEKYCAMNNQKMQAEVVLKERGSEAVPVVHIQCVQEQESAVEG
ncbi:MAG: hypothetical protein ACK4SX_02335 [Alcanivoracaceae bacterium]